VKTTPEKEKEVIFRKKSGADPGFSEREGFILIGFEQLN